LRSPAPKVSVCIPVYNRALYVGTAIESVLAQSFPDFELLLIDDGSTDDSVPVMQRYTDPRIRLECNGVNRGISHTRNRALELARAPCIAWLDSDDRMTPRRLALQLRFLDRHQDVGLLGGWLRRFDDSGRFLGIQAKPLVHEQLRATLLFRTSHANTTVMARTAVLREFSHAAEFFLGEDRDVLLRLSMSGRHRFANLPRILSHQREHAGRITKSRPASLLESKYRLIDRQLRALGIATTQSDLARHYLLTRIKPEDWVTHPDYLRWAARWLTRLLEANRHAGVYAQHALAGVIAQAWIETCARGVRQLGFTQVLSHVSRVPWLASFGGSVAENLIFAAGARR
jgi:glycosyltransferase involved in cell wall biosynthesis